MPRAAVATGSAKRGRRPEALAGGLKPRDVAEAPDGRRRLRPEASGSRAVHGLRDSFRVSRLLAGRAVIILFSRISLGWLHCRGGWLALGLEKCSEIRLFVREICDPLRGRMLTGVLPWGL